MNGRRSFGRPTWHYQWVLVHDFLPRLLGKEFVSEVLASDVNDDPQGPQKIYDRVRALPGVASVGEPELNDEGTVGIVSRPRFRSPGRHPTSWSAGRS